MRRILIERYGRDTVYKEGLKVFIAVNLKADQAAQDAVRNQILGRNGVDYATGFRKDYVKHLDAAKAEKFLKDQEDGFVRDWVWDKWKEALAQGTAAGLSRKDLQATAPDPIPLVKGEIYRGVVTKVDDAAKAVHVRIGNSRGAIDKKGMAWVKLFERFFRWADVSGVREISCFWGISSAC